MASTIIPIYEQASYLYEGILEAIEILNEAKELNDNGVDIKSFLNEAIYHLEESLRDSGNASEER